MVDKREITRPVKPELGYLKKHEGMGTENIDQADIIPPRMKIVQGQTKKKHGADLGTLINDIDGTCYGKKALVIPALHFKSNICFNVDLGIDCRSLDGKVSTTGLDCGKCGKINFTEDAEGKSVKPECNKLFNYIICEEEELAIAIKEKQALPPLVLSFMSSAIKQGKLMNTAIMMNKTRGYPIFSQFFEVKISDEPKDFNKGSAYVADVKVGRYATEDEAEYLKGMYDAYSKMKIDVQVNQDDITPAEETVPSNDDV